MAYHYHFRNIKYIFLIVFLGAFHLSTYYDNFTISNSVMSVDDNHPTAFGSNITKFTTSNVNITKNSIEAKLDTKIPVLGELATTINPNRKQQITIIQSDNRPLESINRDNIQSYNSMAAVINYLYAINHGYNYVYYKYDDSIEDISNRSSSDESYKNSTCLGRASPWCKILSIYDAVGTYTNAPEDFVLYLDSDVVFKHPSRPQEVKNDDDTNFELMEYLQKDPAYDFPNHTLFTGNDQPWSSRHCTGIILTHYMTPWRLGRLMKDWWISGRKHTKYHFEHDYEQHTFNRLIKHKARWNRTAFMLQDNSFIYQTIEGNQTILGREVGIKNRGPWIHPLDSLKPNKTETISQVLFEHYLPYLQNIHLPTIIETIKRNHTKYMGSPKRTPWK